MIQINLSSSQRARRVKLQKEDTGEGRQIILLLVLPVVALAVVGLMWVLQDRRRVTLQQEEVRLATELVTLRAKVKQVEHFERDKKEVEDKIKILLQLKTNQAIPVHILDELNRSLPDRVWFTSIVEQGGAITLQGKGITNNEIVDLINTLKKSYLFTDVEIIESRQVIEERIPVYTFQLKWNLKV